MLDLQRRLLNRKWAALLAVGFCGYLTVATSEMPSTRLPELGTSLERTFTLGSQSSEWKLTAVSTIEITSWHIQVTPAVLLTYVPPAGAKVRVVFDPDVETPTDAGVDTDAETGADGTLASIGSSGSSGLSQPELPPDHVLVGDGTLTVVCGGDPSLCEEVRFQVALEEGEAKTFSLEATAVCSNCASSGAITDLRLEPVQP